MEVKESFLKHLFSEFSGTVTDQVAGLIFRLIETLNTGDLEGFFGAMRSVYASIPYNIFIEGREGYYHTVIYLVLNLIGITIKSEVQTNLGRIDAVVETEDNIYIMEFKVGTAEEALIQVKEKKYYERYLTSQKAVRLIGIGFDTTQRNIGDYKIEELQR